MGWTSSHFDLRGEGYCPVLSISRPYSTNKPWPQLPPDRQFVMKDIMYVNMNTAPHSFLPQQIPVHA
ncbi:MAG: hypothetical protein ACODAQ_09575 [Phycisphaeraceae bacterium]